MTHRTAITSFNIDENLESILEKIKSEKHNAYPVTNGNNLDDIIGIAMMKDIFPIANPENFNLKDYLRQPIYLNENYYAYKVLEIFKKEKNHNGIIIDEYGNTLGIATMHDVLDALVGNTATDDNFDYRIVQKTENTWIADAQFPIVEFIKYFNLDYEFENKDDYTTLVGFFLLERGSSTEVGEKISIEDLQLEIISKDKQRVDQILITRPILPTS